jgi:hypothetical protein
LLVLAEEPLPDSVTFSEKLNRLERLGVIESATTWRLLWKIGNQFAHEYLDQPMPKAAALNQFIRATGELLEFWQRVNSSPLVSLD